MNLMVFSFPFLVVEAEQRKSTLQSTLINLFEPQRSCPPAYLRRKERRKIPETVRPLSFFAAAGAAKIRNDGLLRAKSNGPGTRRNNGADEVH
jgi:hypothetical protein